MNWTHPICVECYQKRYPGRIPMQAKVEMVLTEQCCDCGGLTVSGVYFRADPRTLAHPAVKAD